VIARLLEGRDVLAGEAEGGAVLVHEGSGHLDRRSLTSAGQRLAGSRVDRAWGTEPTVPGGSRTLAGIADQVPDCSQLVLRRLDQGFAEATVLG